MPIKKEIEEKTVQETMIYFVQVTTETVSGIF